MSAVKTVFWGRGALREIETWLAAGYRRETAVVHVARALDAPPPAAGGLHFAPFDESGDPRAPEHPLARALEGCPNRYVDASSAAAFLAGVDRRLGSSLDRRAWAVAMHGERAVGVVLPQLVPGEPEIGTMAFMGLVPEARGHGLGQDLHVLGLASLARLGARRYEDMTDVKNLAMLKVFARNGCRPTAVAHRLSRAA